MKAHNAFQYLGLVFDILLTPDGDLNITENGDIQLPESVRQAIRIRLLWFFSEWRFAPEIGVPYFEDFLIKNLTIANRLYTGKNLAVAFATEIAAFASVWGWILMSY